MAKLSVVLPFYGVEDYLAECLDSILAQTFADFEVIAVDDGSRDGSIDVARAYAERDPRVRIVRQQNQGLGPARNTGVRAATGEYLMFVDSDDLLAPRAFELLVGSLEESGSDFVVGNAWRFSRASGRVPSWTHQIPCAHDRRRTSVREFPALVADRMAWNKVYRRSFWDAHRYEFPAIRYEDYPVTLRAHLDATAVDVLAERIYYWRDRETGESITQQTTNARNAEDRVSSANLVLDLVDAPGVPQSVRSGVHDYLVDVDLVALARALAHADWADRARLETVILRLARRLDKPASGRTTPIAALVHRALLAGDLDFVRTLGRYRETGNIRLLLDPVRRRPGRLPAVASAVLARGVPALSLRRPLVVSMASAVEEAGRFVFNADVKLRDAFNLTAKVSARLRAGDVVVPVLCEPVATARSLKVRVVVSPDDISACQGVDALVEVQADRYALHWAGPIVVGDVTELPPVLDVGAPRWAVARVDESGRLGIGVLDDPLVAEGRKTSDAVADLALNRPAALVARRPEPEAPVALGEGASVRVHATDVEAVPADDPVTRTATLPLTDAAGTPVYASRFPGAIAGDGVVVRVVPDRDGRAQLRLQRS